MVQDFHGTAELNKRIHCFFGETSIKGQKQNLPLELDLGLRFGNFHCPIE